MSRKTKILKALRKKQYEVVKKHVQTGVLSSADITDIVYEFVVKSDIPISDSEILNEIFLALLQNPNLARKDVESLFGKIMKVSLRDFQIEDNKSIAIDRILNIFIGTERFIKDPAKGDSIDKSALYQLILFYWDDVIAQQEKVNTLLGYINDSRGFFGCLRRVVVNKDSANSECWYFPVLHDLVREKAFDLLEICASACQVSDLRLCRIEQFDRDRWSAKSNDTLLDYIMMQDDAELSPVKKLELIGLILRSKGEQLVAIDDPAVFVTFNDEKWEETVGSGLTILTRCFEQVFALESDASDFTEKKEKIISCLLDLGISCDDKSLSIKQYFPLHHLILKSAESDESTFQPMDRIQLLSYRRVYAGSNAFQYALANHQFRIAMAIFQHDQLAALSSLTSFRLMNLISNPEAADLLREVIDAWYQSGSLKEMRNFWISCQYTLFSAIQNKKPHEYLVTLYKQLAKYLPLKSRIPLSIDQIDQLTKTEEGLSFLADKEIFTLYSDDTIEEIKKAVSKVACKALEKNVSAQACPSTDRLSGLVGTYEKFASLLGVRTGWTKYSSYSIPGENGEKSSTSETGFFFYEYYQCLVNSLTQPVTDGPEVQKDDVYTPVGGVSPDGL